MGLVYKKLNPVFQMVREDVINRQVYSNVAIELKGEKK